MRLRRRPYSKFFERSILPDGEEQTQQKSKWLLNPVFEGGGLGAVCKNPKSEY